MKPAEAREIVSIAIRKGWARVTHRAMSNREIHNLFMRKFRVNKKRKKAA